MVCSAREQRFRYIGCFLVGATYAVSFFLPSILNGGTQYDLGGRAFYMGLLGLAMGFPFWLANPFLWAGVYCLTTGRYGWTTTAGLLASGLAGSAVITLGLLSEGSTRAFTVGYYVWVSSCVLLVILGPAGVLVARPDSREEERAGRIA